MIINEKSYGISYFTVKVTRKINREFISKIYCDVAEYKVDPKTKLLILEKKDNKMHYINLNKVYEFEVTQIYE